MFSRLRGLVRPRTDAPAATTVDPVETKGDISVATSTVPDDMRLGLDFGTSTTLVSVKIGGQEPRVLQLESTGRELPSYVALQDGRLIFGEAAVNAGVNTHSVKLALRNERPIAALDGMLPTRAALALIEDALARALERLKREGRLPPATERLSIVSNVGCTPAFTLEQRVRLRDVCRAAGLDVKLVNLIEEPVAAAFEVALSGAVRDGRTLVVDIGGGTLDVSVLEVLENGTRFVLHASSGVELGGDKFTDIIADRMRREMADRNGVAVDELGLSRRQTTAIWIRAEVAKKGLSVEHAVSVVLPDDESTEVLITRDWFDTESKALVDQAVSFITYVYQRSRLTLDREMGDHDRRPGTVDFLGPGGHIEDSVHKFRLEGDAQQHIDVVYLVGGASRMPALRERLDRLFGQKVVDVQIVGMEPTEAVVMGLARHQSMDRIELRNPNWAVEAEFMNGTDRSAHVEVYQPYAPLMSMGPRDTTAIYVSTVNVPEAYRQGSVSIIFRPVVKAVGHRWSAEPIPEGVETLDFYITLFGDVAVWAGKNRLFTDHRAPFTRSGEAGDWLPRAWRDRWREEMPDYDWRYDSY